MITRTEPSSDTSNADTPDTRSVLIRGFMMVVIAIFFGFGEAVLALIMITQFFWLLFTRHHNEALRRFGRSLSIWFSQAASFQACETENKPFPWAPWPNGQMR